jgi:hypothetical protein
VLDYLKSGRSNPEGFAEARKAMMNQLAGLSRRVRAARA